MTDSAREAYLRGVDARFLPIVVALDRAVARADANLDTAIKYRMLTYTLGGDYKHWICAIDARQKVVCLRFLAGVLLEDARGVLRAGTGPLKTIDYTSIDEVDPQLVTAYVNEALLRLDDFKAGARSR